MLHKQTESQRQLCDRISRFSHEVLNPDIKEVEGAGRFRTDAWKKSVALGLPGLTVGAGFGGAGLDIPAATSAIESLGKSCLDNGFSFSLIAQLANVCMPIERFGTAGQKSRWLHALCQGTAIGCQAITERGAGSDVLAMKTSATQSGKGFLLDGTKAFSTSASIADVAVVLAVTDAAKGTTGLTAFLVDLSLPGVRKSEPDAKLGLRTSQMGELVFDNVLLSEEDVLGDVGCGMFVLTYSMNLERVFLFALHCGAMERVFEKTLEYAKTRQQFGAPIGKNQAVAHRIVDMHMDLEVSRYLVYRAAQELTGKKSGLCIEACMAKLFVSEAYVRAGLASLQIHGGAGYSAEAGVERELRDALGSTIYAGTSEIQRNTIAKSLGLA